MEAQAPQTPIQITAGGVCLDRREHGDMERALPDSRPVNQAFRDRALGRAH
jgi:hypothetical protein